MNDNQMISKIESMVLEYHGFKPAEIRQNRQSKYVNVRHQIFVLCRNMGIGTMDIGMHFGKDHSTVVHGSNKHRDKMQLKDRISAKYQRDYLAMKHRVYCEFNKPETVGQCSAYTFPGINQIEDGD